jgi:hypothetical protein
VDEDQFWALIAHSRDQEPGGGDQMAEALRERLAQLSADEVYAFGRFWNAAFDRLCTWPVWDAASVLLGWVGDDSFRDVRAWIVSHGRSVVDMVVENPDSLAELAFDEDNAFEEGFDGIAYKTYQSVAGHLPEFERGSGDPAGERTNLKDRAAVTTRFPRLAELALAKKPADLVDMSKVVWAPDEGHRCPHCSQTLTRMSIRHLGEVDGVSRVEQEFRACTACFEFAVRTGQGKWTAVARDEVPTMVRLTFLRR